MFRAVSKRVPCLVVAAMIPSAAAVAQTAPPALHSTWYTLGTNGGPIARPLRSEPANLLVYGEEVVLVDCGDGAAEQLAKVNVPVRKVTAVVISHLHFDHTGGLFAVLGMRFQAVPPPVLTIYGPPGTKRTVDGLLAAMQPEAESGAGIPGAPHRSPEEYVKVIEVGDGDRFKLGAIEVTARRNSHYSYPKGSEEEKLHQSLAYRFDAPDRSLVYTGDTGPSAAVEELAKGADILFSEVTDPAVALAAVKMSNPELPPFVLQMMAQHMEEQHLNATQVGLLAKKAAVKEVVLVHTSKEEAVTAIAVIAKNYLGKVVVANDLDSF